jgi:CheY-like chemotaxis protein
MEQAGTTILVVDDDPDIREGLSSVLEMHGYRVVQAENGREALHTLKHIDRLPLAVVLDMAMPVLDGRGFLEQRARDQILASIPVIVVSGNQPDEALDGVEAFFQKPVEIMRLLQSISHIETSREH